MVLNVVGCSRASRPSTLRSCRVAVVGVAVDRRDHVWITHRPSTLQPNETRSIWRAAPLVLEFGRDGTPLSSWGGPGPGYQWPRLEHGVYVDQQDHVWLGGGGEKDAQARADTSAGLVTREAMLDNRVLPAEAGLALHYGRWRGDNATSDI